MQDEIQGNKKSAISFVNCEEPNSKLAKAHAPFWTHWALWLSVAGLVLFLYLTLIGNLDEYVIAFGEVRPKDYTIVFSTAPGILQELLVDEGDEVASGDVVARLWFLPEQVAIDPMGLKPYEIRSPDSGRVISTTRLLRGERVMLGAPLVKLVRSDERELRIYATEDRIDRIQKGQLVRFRVRSNPDRMAPPAIGRITNVAKDKDLIREDGARVGAPTYYVKASVEYSEYDLPLGSQVDAEIVLGRRKFWEMVILRMQNQNKIR